MPKLDFKPHDGGMQPAELGWDTRVVVKFAGGGLSIPRPAEAYDWAERGLWAITHYAIVKENVNAPSA